MGAAVTARSPSTFGRNGIAANFDLVTPSVLVLVRIRFYHSLVRQSFWKLGMD
jgi:hypothetical protein